MRLNGGELCVPGIPSVDVLAKLVNREVVLADGRHATLELQYIPGAPTNIDSLIFGLQTQNISLLIFRGHTYYLAGATYDEYIGLDGGRMLQVKELRLANTFAGKPGIAFVRGRDNPDDIQGTMTVSVVFPKPLTLFADTKAAEDQIQNVIRGGFAVMASSGRRAP